MNAPPSRPQSGPDVALSYVRMRLQEKRARRVCFRAEELVLELSVGIPLCDFPRYRRAASAEIPSMTDRISSPLETYISKIRAETQATRSHGTAAFVRIS